MCWAPSNDIKEGEKLKEHGHADDADEQQESGQHEFKSNSICKGVHQSSVLKRAYRAGRLTHSEWLWLWSERMGTSGLEAVASHLVDAVPELMVVDVHGCRLLRSTSVGLL